MKGGREKTQTNIVKEILDDFFYHPKVRDFRATLEYYYFVPAH